MGISQYMLDQTVPPVRLRIGQSIEEAIAFGVFGLVIAVALLLVTKGFTVGDQKLKIPRFRLICVWIIDLIDDAMAERELEPATRMIRSDVPFFGSGSSARLASVSVARY